MLRRLLDGLLDGETHDHGMQVLRIDDAYGIGARDVIPSRSSAVCLKESTMASFT